MRFERRPPRSLLLAVALALSGVAAAAEPEAIVIDVKDPLVRTRAELDVVVDGAPAGTAFVILERGDALVLPQDLTQAGLSLGDLPGGTVVVIDDVPRLSLRSLSPTLSFEVDERELTLRITVPPELLGRHRLDLRPTLRPAEVEYRSDPSAHLDYAVQGTSDGDLALSFEAGGRVAGWLGTTDVTRGTGGTWVRGLTSAVRDDVPGLRRWTVGDGLASSGALGGSVLLGGLSIGREFSLDPYLVKGPLPATTAVITAPSTLEVYVNGAMVRQQPIGPGYWDLANLPASAGQTLVHTVVRDAFGREQSYDTRFYFSSGLLAPGLTDYAYAVGFRREAFARESFSYDGPAGVARHRFGVSEWLTAGLRGEASTGLASGGGSATVALPWGELEGVAGLSVAGGRAGGAARAGWLWLTRGWSFGLRLGAQSDHYAHLSQEHSADRPLLDAQAVAGVSLSRRLGLSADVRIGRWRDLGDWGTAGLQGSISLGAGATLFLSTDYGRDPGGARGLQGMVLLAWSHGGNQSVEASTAVDRAGRVVGALGATRPVARNVGWGYRVRGTGDGDEETLDAALQGQSTFGRGELQVTRAGGTTTARAQGSGGLVLIDRRLFFSRPTDGSFALVETGGLAGVGVTLENGDVGRTGPDGTLLVPGLQPYYASRLAIRDADVPDAFDPGRTERLIAAPLRGGAIVAFDLQRISAISGQLSVRIEGRDERPANGRLSTIVDGELRTSPITPEGRFFLERMPPGKHVVQASWGAGSCRAAITLPRAAPPVFDAGEVRCILDSLEPEGKVPRPDDPAWADRPSPPAPSSGAGGGGDGK